ncbi:MAG: hypothetical protein E6X17_10680 [Sporomusaceae bacterium]|nr:hypothetical protein [Sporomusaceae bacterium]
MAAWPLLDPGRRRMVLLFVLLAIAAWSMAPIDAQPEAVPLAALSDKPRAAAADRRFSMPKGADQPGLRRDPFLPPQPAVPAVAAVSAGGGKAAALPVRVAGIASGGNGAVAILESRTGSRAYRVGEYAGAYRIEAIAADSVLLAGPDGQHRLRLGGRAQ